MTDGKKENQGPLQGLRVIDLSMMLAGPSGSMLMGDLGAEIIKVEPLDGDETRVGPSLFLCGEHERLLSGRSTATRRASSST